MNTETTPTIPESSLPTGTPIVDVKNTSSELLLKRMVSWKWITIFSIVVIISLFISIQMGAILVGLYIGTYLATQQFLKERKLMQGYAGSRGLQFADNLDTQALTGRLLPQLEDTREKMYLVTTYNGFLTKAFYFKIEEGSGKHRRIYSYTTLEITIQDAVFPYILLLRKGVTKRQSTDFFGDDKDVEINFNNAHDDSYVLSTTKNYEIEALQACSQEFVDILQKSSLNLSAEFAGNHLYIYLEKTLSTEQELDELFRVGKAIIDTSGQRLARLRDDYQSLHEVYRKK